MGELIVPPERRNIIRRRKVEAAPIAEAAPASSEEMKAQQERSDKKIEGKITTDIQAWKERKRRKQAEDILGIGDSFLKGKEQKNGTDENTVGYKIAGGERE